MIRKANVARHSTNLATRNLLTGQSSGTTNDKTIHTFCNLSNHQSSMRPQVLLGPEESTLR